MGYGKPAACVLFDLAYYLNQDLASMLWLALVGLTDQLVHGRITGGWPPRACAGERVSAAAALPHEGRAVPFAPAWEAATHAARVPPSLCRAADRYQGYYLHYETHVLSAGHLDLQVGWWGPGWPGAGC